MTKEARGIKIECPDCGEIHAPPEIEAFDDLVRTACIAVSETVQPLYQKFGMRDPGGRWDIDDQKGLIFWTNAEGRVSRAHYQFVGRWLDKNGSFKWGWDHPHATEATEIAAQRVFEYGEERGFPVLTSNLLIVDQDNAWHMADVAAYLSGLPGVYRAKVNDVAWQYFAFSEPEWVDA